MAKTCNNCIIKSNSAKYSDNTANKSTAVLQTACAHFERVNRRLWLLILILIIALIGTNVAWAIYDNSTITLEIEQDVEQDADSGSNIFIGGNNYGETESENED